MRDALNLGPGLILRSSTFNKMDWYYTETLPGIIRFYKYEIALRFQMIYFLSVTAAPW